MDNARMVKISKYLSHHLRHHPERLGLTVAPGGWVDVDILLAACRGHHCCLTLAELEEVVRRNDKQRFSFDETGQRIRANQGHSIKVIGVNTVEPPETAAVNPGDIRYETMCASGPGGQHVNKTESAVRAIHVPTELKAVARDHRSQHRNKELALKRLLHQLSQIEKQSHEQNRRRSWDRHNDLERGNPVRTYTGEEFL